MIHAVCAAVHHGRHPASRAASGPGRVLHPADGAVQRRQRAARRARLQLLLDGAVRRERPVGGAAIDGAHRYLTILRRLVWQRGRFWRRASGRRRDSGRAVIRALVFRRLLRPARWCRSVSRSVGRSVNVLLASRCASDARRTTCQRASASRVDVCRVCAGEDAKRNSHEASGTHTAHADHACATVTSSENPLQINCVEAWRNLSRYRAHVARHRTARERSLSTIEAQ